MIPDHLGIIPDYPAIVPDRLGIIPDYPAIVPDRLGIIPDRLGIIPDCVVSSNIFGLTLNRES